MAKKKKQNIIGWVDAEGRASTTQPTVEQTRQADQRANQIIGYVNPQGQSQTTQYGKQLMSVENTVNALNSIKPLKTENTITDENGNVTVTPKKEKTSFSFTADDKKKTTEDYKKERDEAYEKLEKYKKEKGINILNRDSKKVKNDKTYQQLLKDTQEKQKSYDDSRVNKNAEKTKKVLEENQNIGGSIAKFGIAYGSGITRGVGGIESTARKLTGQVNETERQKYDIMEPMLNKAYETASKPEQVAMGLGQSWGQMVPQMLAGNPTGATALGFANYGGSAYNDAKKDGATEEQATAYLIASGGTEMFMEKLLGGFENIYGKKMAPDFTKNVMSKLIKNKAVRDTLSGMKGEFTEEYLQEFLEPILKNIILKENNGADFWNTMKDDIGLGLKQLGSQFFNQQNLEAGLMGGLSSGLLQGPMNIAMNQQARQNGMTMDEYMNNIQPSKTTPVEQNIREDLTQEQVQSNVQQPINQIQPQIPTQTPLNTLNQGVQEQNVETPYQTQTPQITPLNQVNQELQETRKNDIADSVQAMNLEKQPEFKQKEGNYVYEKSDNSKIDNLRKDAANYLKEGEQTTNFVNTLEKLVKDKDIEIRFDTKLGNNVNGTYKNGVITLNPNSNRAGEFVAIHELTHAIGTKPMIDMIQTYRKSNAEFNNAVERLLSTYKTTEINEEALGDIAGQLFGNQEYINNLSMENPSLFKKIYNEIKYLWHQFTGYKNQDQFIEDLRNKWESAYRNQKIQQKAKNSNIEMSNQTDSNGNMLSNEQVDYFKDSKVRDENGNLIIMNHATSNNSFTIFDENKQGTNSSNFKQKGELGRGFYFSDEQTAYTTWNDYVERQTGKPVKGMSVYLRINNPFYYSTSELNKDVKNYLKDKDAIMSRIKSNADIIKFANFTNLDIQNMLKELGYDGIIERDDNNIYQAVVFNSNQIKNIDNLTPTKSDDIRYSKNEELDNSSFIIEKNEDVNKLELPKSPYQTLRPNVRGGWNIDKIQKQLKNESSNRVNSKELSKFDNLDDLMNNIYYHGSISAHDNLKAGSTLQENQRTGGYGEEYHSISLSGNKNIASNFASMGVSGTVMPVILKKGSNVIEMPNIEDSIELEEILPELWNKGVDAVKIGDWDIEKKGYGEQEIVILNPRAIMTMPQGTTYFQNYHKPKFQNMTKEEILETLTKTKERALNDPKLKPGQVEEIESRYDKLIKYSKDNQTWKEYLEKEFPSQGTRTNLGEVTGRKQKETTKPTTETKTTPEKPKNVSKQNYLTKVEQEELETLKELDDKGFLEETDKDYKRLQELEKKQQGIVKKFPELKKENTFEDIKGIYGKYKNNEISTENNKVLKQAKNFIEANKQGRRTKEQWLQVAEFIGNNADIKSSQDLQQLAMETWFETKPNNSNVLNRQGQKYVKFPVNEWVDAVYKGAGVGTDVKLSVEEKSNINEPKKDEVAVLRAPTEIKPKEMAKNPVADSVKAMNLEKENIKYSAEEKIEKSVRNQYKGLSEDKIQQIIELKEEQKEKDKMYSNFSNKQRAKQRIMINAYETNAKIRKIVQGDSLQKVKGGLTDTELAKTIEKENSNYIGKNVMVDGQKATIIGNPYGRVKVEFEDGSIKTFDKDDITTINKPKQDDVVMMKATDTKGNKVDLKPTGNKTYEEINVKPKKTDVIPDMSNKVLNIGDEKVSNFYSNITEKSKFITEENRETLKDNANLKYYDAITNKDTLQNAMDKLDKNTEQQVGDFFAKKDFNAEDVATGWILVKRYQDAGNFEAMSNVIEKMREQGTKAGQTVQMYGILQRLTPEGMEYYSQKQLDNAYNKFVEGKSKKQIDKYAKDFTLTAEEHQFIKDTMEKVQNMTDEEQKKVEIAKIVSMLNQKLPPEKGQRLKAWMRIAMLGNPKTQVRNVAGNAIIQPVNWAGDVFAATADKIMSKQTGKRTIGKTDFGALTRGTKQGLKDAIRDAKTGVDTRDINLDRFEENIGANPFYEEHKSQILNTAAKALNKTNKILGNIMSGGDRIFYQGIYENSLANQMKLNNVTKPTQEMINIAEQEALSRTWNDSNEYTKAVLQIRNAMNKLNVKGYGLGDVLVPFAKTPANLTKAIVDYSPVGLTRSILQDGKNYKNSLENGQYSPELQHKFAENLGKGMAGSLLYLTAYALAQAGITSGASDDDKDVANFIRNTLGIQPYSVKIGDKSFTYDWAQPIAAPFAIMADAKRLSEKENQELGDIITTATSSASNILLEQSFLSSIQDVFNSYEGPSAAIKQQIQDLPARATPTFFKQIADLIDPTSRQTFVKGDEGQTLKNKVQVKIPGASKELVSQRDTLGREIQKYGGDEDKLKYAFNIFLNPANTNKGKPSKAAKEIYEVYKATGDKTVMPRQVGYSENIGGTTRNLTAKERNEWQKLSGEKIEENVKALTNNSKYKAMSDEDKAAVINGIVNYSYAKAKSDLFDTNISTMYKTAAKKEEQGIPLYDYYINRVSKRR